MEYPKLMNHRFIWLLKKAILMALWTKTSLCVKSSLLEQRLPRTPSRQKQNQCNLRNLRLINSCLCGYESFMQNKANFRKSQMNVTKVITTDYEKRTLSEPGKNKANSNPIKANTNPIKANIMPKQIQNEPKQSQFQTQFPPRTIRHPTYNIRNTKPICWIFK